MWHHQCPITIHPVLVVKRRITHAIFLSSDVANHLQFDSAPAPLVHITHVIYRLLNSDVVNYLQFDTAPSSLVQNNTASADLLGDVNQTPDVVRLTTACGGEVGTGQRMVD